MLSITSPAILMSRHMTPDHEQSLLFWWKKVSLFACFGPNYASWQLHCKKVSLVTLDRAVNSPEREFPTYSLIAFDERVTFWLQRVQSLVRVCMLHYLRVGSRITITQSHKHTMQQTHTHKAVTGRVEAKKLLSRRRQSEYRYTVNRKCCKMEKST